MMNNVFCIFILFLISNNVKGQIIMAPHGRDIFTGQTVDSCNFRIFYSLSNNDEKDKITDIQVLEIGNKISKYYSYTAFRSDSLISEFKRKHKGASSVPIDTLLMELE